MCVCVYVRAHVCMTVIQNQRKYSNEYFPISGLHLSVQVVQLRVLKKLDNRREKITR